MRTRPDTEDFFTYSLFPLGTKSLTTSPIVLTGMPVCVCVCMGAWLSVTELRVLVRCGGLAASGKGSM
jgi:hypothetical protein